jgi:hypothetical protein
VDPPDDGEDHEKKDRQAKHREALSMRAPGPGSMPHGQNGTIASDCR